MNPEITPTDTPHNAPLPLADKSEAPVETDIGRDRFGKRYPFPSTAKNAGYHLMVRPREKR